MLRGHALAGSTNAKYSGHWKQWTKFAARMGWSPWFRRSGRTANKRLGHFAVYLWTYGWNARQHGNRYSTIQLKIASIRWYHRRFCGIELAASPDFTILLQGIKRLSDPTTKKQPITPAFLRLLHRRTLWSQPRQRLLWGCIVIGYFFLLRRSEYLKIGAKRHFYCLKTSNVFFSDSRGNRTTAAAATSVTIGLEGAKNDQFGRGAWRTMHRSENPVICPVAALRHILKARREMGQHAARYLTVDLSAADVAKALKDTARAAQVPASNYSTHSIRSGGATALVNGGADSLVVKLLGRWMSNCYEEYPLLAATTTARLSERMV